MANNRILWVTSLLAFIFASSAAIMMGFSVVVGQIRDKPDPVDGFEAARHLMYKQFPLDAGIANAVLMFATFLLIVPGLVTPTRGLLKFAGGAIALCSIFTLCIGVFLWVLTLNTKAAFLSDWKGQSQDIQGLMENSVGFSCILYLIWDPAPRSGHGHGSEGATCRCGCGTVWGHDMGASTKGTSLLTADAA